MRRRNFPLLVGLLVCANVAVSSPARADWSVGIDRLFGLSRIIFDPDPGGTTSATSFSFLGSPIPPGYSSPRLSVDYLSRSRFTFGGAMAYQNVNFDDAGDVSRLIFAPRVGYMIRISPSFGLWPRGGVTHATGELGDTDDTSTALTFEMPLVFFVLRRSVGLQILPHADVGVGGERNEDDYTVTELGMSFAVSLML